MVFSDTSTKAGILQRCERYCGFNYGDITGNTSLLAEFTSNANQASKAVWGWIFNAYGGWQYDDGNQTNLPAATDTLTTDQATYALPSEALTVRGVEVKDTGGIWSPLTPITEEMIRERGGMGEFMATSGQPRYYQLVGSTVRLYPPSNYTQSASFKVFYDRGNVNFASSDTTTTPGFAEVFHEAIPVGASLFWLKANKADSPTLQELKQDWAQLEARITKFYVNRWHNNKPSRIGVPDSTRLYV